MKSADTALDALHKLIADFLLMKQERDELLEENVALRDENESLREENASLRALLPPSPFVPIADVPVRQVTGVQTEDEHE